MLKSELLKIVEEKMIESVLLKIADIDLNARDMQIFNAYSNKKSSSDIGDSEMQEFSEVAEKVKSALLANLATLSVNKLIPLLTSCNMDFGFPFGADNPHNLGYFGKIVKGKFTGREINKLFALSEARSKYIDGKIDDFSEADEQTLEELAQKARGILIAKIEPCDAVKLFTEPENVCK